ncbi:hypothetical protein C9374_007712 [Naegleria lovaniensis]|uniref:Uncharacterized protein n=1 Tax=Naegleria lovaniensis TaxID=51637 RepID=A0AA88GGN7_NAELO|nr:uncharacterized protein C9374_007712 [Naegleria lovaniensis]KAG2379074.1 hypothetical protein C9374_007712 [Naegleria lovaniensis]
MSRSTTSSPSLPSTPQRSHHSMIHHHHPHHDNDEHDMETLVHEETPTTTHPKTTISTPLSVVSGYSITILGIQMLNHIFNSYYVETFLFIHKLPSSYFYIGQFLFAIFNAINDPLFGYISDELIYHHGIYKKYTRQQIMLYGCPLLVISFLLPWIQLRSLFEPYSNGMGDFIALIQFILALFLWDSSFTWVVLNHCALLPELTESDKEKGRISTAVSVCSVLGSLFLLPTFYLFERPNSQESSYSGNLSSFRLYCTIVAILSLGILWCGNYLINRGMEMMRRGEYSLIGRTRSEDATTAAEDDHDDTTSTTTASSSPRLVHNSDSQLQQQQQHDSLVYRIQRVVQFIKSYLLDFFKIFKQLVTLRNFVLFVAVNFMNIFTVALFDSFKVRYIRYYVQPWMNSQVNSNDSTQNFASIYLTFCTFIAECFAVLNSYLSIRYSAYSLLRNTFIFRAVVSSMTLLLFLIFVSEDHLRGSMLPTLFLFVNLIVLGSVGRLLEISLSKVVDEDCYYYKRKEKNSGNIYGINALLTKPAFSLAPSIAALFIGKDDSSSSNGSMPTLFYLFVIGNLVCALLQLILWRFYTLRGDTIAPSSSNASPPGAIRNNNEK